MTSPAVPASGVPAGATAQRPLLDTIFGRLWPETEPAGRPRLLLAAVGAGLVAAIVVPFRDAGIGSFLVLMTVCMVVAVADRRLRTPYHLLSGAVCALLLTTLFLRDAQWLVALCVLAAFAVGSVALAGGRSLPGMVASGAAVPLAALRGLPWLGRCFGSAGRPARWWPTVRTVLLSALLLVVFGALLASADALFASWVGALVPDLTIGSTVLRGFVWLAVAGLTLAGMYVALNPPAVERLQLPPGRPVSRPFEWLVPVGLVVALLLGFVVAQLTVMFGGHDYLRRTTGLTYAEYVHQGFGQLTVATMLTLAVVAATARKAARSSLRDRTVLRVVLGLLCMLTLVVVASALYRLHVYEQAYGFTRLRLLVGFYEAWLGLVVVLVLVAGIRLRGRWLPRSALLTGAGALLVLAVLNPDAYIAEHNLGRWEQTGKVDWAYLAGLSADATPALAGHPAEFRGCAAGAVGARQDDWLEWNLGRARARAACAGR